MRSLMASMTGAAQGPNFSSRLPGKKPRERPDGTFSTNYWIRPSTAPDTALRLNTTGHTLEFLCLLPLTIPAIVLVVGLAPVYAWVTYFLGGSSLTLTFAYVILVLPFAYRALDAGLSAIDVKTLSEAARSLVPSEAGAAP